MTSRSVLGGVPIGDGAAVVVMGVLNVSPESFFSGSVRRGSDELLRAASAMVDAGAAFVDVGARSTAPYLDTTISEDEECRRLAEAVGVLAAKLPVPVSADTARAAAARVAIDAGARIVNDVSGLSDVGLAPLVAEAGVSLILMARPSANHVLSDDPIATVEARLRQGLRLAAAAGIPDERIVLDPGIGFFRKSPLSWDEWDVRVLAGLRRLHDLGRPLCVGVSRKSFIGAITGRSPAERLAGSLAATTVAVLGGAAVVRTHDVAETVDVVRVAERVRRVWRP